jgi:hypothetical protein
MAENKDRREDTGGEVAAFRAAQQEMAAIGRQYSQERQAVWARELEAMSAAWQEFHQDWRGTLEQMTSAAAAGFDDMAARGEAAAGMVAQSWRQALLEISGGLDLLGEHLSLALDQMGQGWQLALGGGGSGGGLLSWLGLGFDFGGMFHEGGIVEAHRGLTVSPERLLEDERLVKVQTGEGILPREAMVRLGEENFEALRSGRFQVGGGGGAPRFDITIQVQSLDPAAAAGMDWDRVVQRHLLPALERELGRRW